MALVLRNPHSVLAVLETRPQDILEIHFPSLGRPEALGPGQVLRPEGRSQGHGKIGKEGSKDGTVGHGRRDRETAPAGLPGTALFQRLGSRTLVGLGMASRILRTWAPSSGLPPFFAVRGMLLTRHRSAPLSHDGLRRGLGRRRIRALLRPDQPEPRARPGQSAGLWILGTSEHAETDLAEIDRDRPWLLLLGREDRGLRTLLAKKM